jgi:choline dehydrogenase-like flavoprotein
VIRTGADVADGFHLRTDVCVIGSGSGGGVAAAILAERGREVVLLEEGQQVTPSMMTMREEQMYPLLYRDGGNQLTHDGGVSVLQGRVLGGSTVINAADVVEIPDGVHAHWAQHYQLTRYGLGNVREADAAVREAIHAIRIPDEQVNRNNAMLLKGAAKLGNPGRTFVTNRQGCVGNGTCLIGCPLGAKQSVDLTWIPRARATGNTMVQTDARVSHFEVDGGRVSTVHGHIIRRGNETSVAPFTVQADTVILAAGAIHSPLLLQRSGLGGSLVGRNLSLQPQCPTVALFDDEVVMHRGIPQAVYLDHRETATAAAGLGGFRLESIAATPGMAAATTMVGPTDLHSFMRQYRHMAAVLCLVPDRPSGRVTDNKGRPRIDYTMTPKVAQSLKDAAAEAARVFLAAGASRVALPFAHALPVSSEADLAQIDALKVDPAAIALISAHPQGTCRMGPDPAKSVVGMDLKVHGAENLWVMDASIFPTTSSTHTMVPVMSYAWLAAHEV